MREEIERVGVCNYPHLNSSIYIAIICLWPYKWNWMKFFHMNTIFDRTFIFCLYSVFYKRGLLFIKNVNKLLEKHCLKAREVFIKSCISAQNGDLFFMWILIL